MRNFLNRQIKSLLSISLLSIITTYVVASLVYVIYSNNFPTLEGIWNHWDTKWYLRIAEFGYEYFGDGQLSITFFPLYPLLIRLIGVVFKDYLLSALFISNVSFIVALFFFYKLVKEDFSKKIAWKSIIYLSIFPTAYFLHAGYTESLFLALVFASVYLSRKKKWFEASAVGMLASFTRFNGITLFPFFIVEYLSSKKFNLRIIKYDIVWSLLILVGFVSYLFWNNHIYGDPFYFKSIFEEITWERPSLPWVGLIDAIGRYYRYSLADWVVEGLMVIVFWLLNIALLVYSLKKVRLSYNVFLWLNFFLMTTTSIWSGLPRYSLFLFPIFISLALWAKHPVKNYLITFFFILLQGIFLTLFVQGRWAF